MGGHEMETKKKLGTLREIRRITPDGKVYILRRKIRPSIQGTIVQGVSKAEKREVAK